MSNIGGSLNPSAYTIYSQKLNDYRKQLLKSSSSVNADQGDNDSQEEWEGEKKLYGQGLQKKAEYLEALGIVNAGRGVNKAQFTPAEQAGIMPQNPNFFGVQRKEPIPYAQMLTNQKNLEQVMKGFQENMYGQLEGNDGTTMAQVLRQSRLIGQAFDRQKNNSLYANIPKDPEVNLYNIKVRNRRMNSIYALN